MELTETQLSDLITGAVDKAIKAINPPDPAQVPGQSTKSVGANVNLRRYNPFPSLQRAVNAAKAGRFDDKSAFERDFVQAAKLAFNYVGEGADGVGDHSVIWPTNLDEARTVFAYMGEREAAKSLDQIDAAVKSIDATKAMTEAVTSTFTAGTAGGYLVPPQFLQSLFSYNLAPRVALRNVPGINVVQVDSPTVYLPRESTRAGASQASEAGTLTVADATLGIQTITIQKQFASRRWSSELANDSNPAFSSFLSNTLGRDLALQQDSQYLTGSGTPPAITGILNYSSLTTGPSLGTNGRTIKNDDILQAAYLLENANSEANFVICHPRTLNSLRQEKDNEGRYLVSTQPVAWVGASTQAGPQKVLAGYIPVQTTTSLSITQTVGSSSDCTTVIIGDAGQVYIFERQGIEIMFSEHVYFATDELAVRAIARSAVAILQPSAVELITGVRS